MRLVHALLPLLLQACGAPAQDLPAPDRAIAFQGEWTAALRLCLPLPGTLGGDQTPECSPGPFP